MVTNPNLPISTQFNMFLGFSIDVVKLIDEMTKLLDLLRNKPGQLSGTSIANIFTLISRARNNDIVPKVNKETFVIPKESIGHPEYKNLINLFYLNLVIHMKSSMIIVLPPVRMAAQKKQYITHGTIGVNNYILIVYI